MTGSFHPAVISISGTITTGGAYSGLTISVRFGGAGYSVGDVIVISGTHPIFSGLSGANVVTGTTPLNDLTLTVASLSGTGIATFSTAVGNGPAFSGGGSFAINGLLDLEFVNRRNRPTVLRDSSDYTRQLKERLIYNEFQTQVGQSKRDRRGGISSAGPGAAGTLWDQQSNQFRLSYLFGKRNCGNCAGGWFNTNGVRNFPIDAVTGLPGPQTGT